MHVLISALSRFTEPTGICRNAANQALALAGMDEVTAVTVVVGRWQHRYYSHALQLRSAKIKLTSADCGNTSVGRNLWFAFRLPEVAKRHQADIVHLSFPVPVLRRKFSVPVVATIHDLYPFDIPENFGYPNVLFNRVFFRQCIQQVDAIVCVSEVTQQQLRSRFARALEGKPVAVVHSYVELQGDGVCPIGMADGSAPFILTVGQHRANKNLDVILRAFSKLLEGEHISPATHLVIVGAPGPETAELHVLVTRLDLQERVVFLSGLTNRELVWMYQGCVVFVVASSAEGFCLPLAEALQFGTPVVCSDIPVLREVGSEACQYFQLDSSSVENLARAIKSSWDKGRSDTAPRSRFSRQDTGCGYFNMYARVRKGNAATLSTG